jgi:hypothetical protein
VEGSLDGVFDGSGGFPFDPSKEAASSPSLIENGCNASTKFMRQVLLKWKAVPAVWLLTTVCCVCMCVTLGVALFLLFTFYNAIHL